MHTQFLQPSTPQAVWTFSTIVNYVREYVFTGNQQMNLSKEIYLFLIVSA
ncbi:unnamed protein product, partial [Larinioides sclopetarius]